MNDTIYALFWMISLLISGAGTWLWVKLLLRVDPTWNAKEHKWGQYIFAGVLSIFVATVLYYLGFMFWGGFNSAYPSLSTDRPRNGASSWFSVLNTRRRLQYGAAYRGRDGDLKRHLTRMSARVMALFKKRLSFYLKDEALRWIRRVEYFEREGVLFRSESIWSKTN